MHEVSFRITKFAINPDSGKVDKKKPTETTVKVRARGYRRELMLVETKTGKPRWRRTTAYHLVDEKTGKPVWAFNKELEYHEQVNGRFIVGSATTTRCSNWSARGWRFPFGICTDGREQGAVASSAPENRPSPCLVLTESCRAVGPLSNCRRRSIRAPDSRPMSAAPTLRRCSPSPRNRRRSSCLIYTSARQQLAAAGGAETQDRHDGPHHSELRDRKRYREYGNAEYLKAFGDELSIPADLKRELLDRMKQIPSESRAGRKRDYRFFQPIVDRIKARQLRDSKATLDAAAGVQPIREVDAGAMVCDAEADGPLRTVVAGCWDQSVKAFDLATGKCIGYRSSAAVKSLWSTIRRND